MIKLLSSCIPFLLGFSMFFLVSCDDDPSDLGIDLLPGGDKFFITTADSFTFHSWTDTSDFGLIRTYPLYKRDTYDQVMSYNGSVLADSFNIVGDYKDNVFGRTTSAFIFKMNYLPSVNEPVEDSINFVDIILSLKPHVGAIRNLNFKLFAVNKKLTDTITYSNFNYLNYLNPIEHVVSWDKDTVIRFTIKDNNLIRYLYKDSTSTNKDSTFNANVFGFCIIAQPITDGAAVRIKSLKSLYEITYTKDDSVRILKLPLINQNYFSGYSTPSITYHFSTITHDISGSMFESNLSNQSYMFLLGGHGSTGRLNIDTSSIRSWRKALNFSFNKENTDSSHIAINKVELTLKPEEIAGVDSSVYPENLALVGISDTTRYFLEDYSLGNIRGKYNPEEDVYKFNITKYFTEYLKGNRFIPNFEIRIPQAESSYSRVVFRNNNYKLKITYSKIQ